MYHYNISRNTYHAHNPSIEMSTTWQTHVLALLDTNHASIFDSLLFTLRTRLLIYSHHHEVLQIHTNDIIDLWSEQIPGEVKDLNAVVLQHLNKLSSKKFQRGYHHSNSMFYIKQWHPVSQGLPGACGCNGNDILAIQYSPNYTNVPETCMYTKGFKDLSLGFL